MFLYFCNVFSWVVSFSLNVLYAVNGWDLRVSESEGFLEFIVLIFLILLLET